MKRTYLRLIQLMLCNTALWYGLNATAQIEIHMRLLPDQGLSLEYHVPPQCTQLRFDKDGPLAQQIRASWRAEDECASIEGDEIKLKPQCHVARFFVPSSVNKVTGYPAAFPMAKALYVHTSNYQLDSRCGEMRYSMFAPHLAYEGRAYQSSSRFAPAAESSFPILFSTQALTIDAGTGVLSYVDENLSPAYVSRIQEVSRETIKYLRTAMPKARFMMPILAAANVPHAGAVGFDGDAGNVLRLGLFNWPSEYTAQEKKSISDFVGHEFSHRFQKRDEVDIYPLSRVIHEGGGEYLRWHTAVQLGWMNQEEAAKDLDDALNRCLLGVENKPWQALSKNYTAPRQLDYRCGFAAYVFGLAARKNLSVGISNVAEFYAKIQDGIRPDFFDAIECGDKLDCHPRWLPQLFTSAIPMATVWDDFFQQTGFARRVPPNQVQLDMMIKKVFSSMIKEDCGESSVFEASDGLIIDDLKACKQLKPKMKVIGLEGYAIFGNTQALPALLTACQQHGLASVQVTNQESLYLTCKTPFSLNSYFYATDITKLLKAL
ncbi:hypothetical protein [Undibacterium sp. Di24W]|uniref:hypothetical protein n=1 Tax=Undibacterium sp. Di24W TaxID=3413033 RepID=UPI003BF2680C